MAEVMREWESTEPNPDEEHLKALWYAEVESLERSLREAEEASRRQQARIMPLIEGSGLSEDEIVGWLEEDAELSRRSWKESEPQISEPAIDFASLHEQDLSLAQANAESMESTGGNPWWQGWIFNPSYGGWWSAWNGESEEAPGVTFNFGGSRFDPRAQAWGEGWWDADWSHIHAYLAFRFRPPSYGHLHVHIYPWLHGYYSLYSNDAWYKGEYARAELDTWVQVHQNFWRGRQYWRRFTMSGGELHPERSDRIDGRFYHGYYTNVGAHDTVTIRIGTRLYCRGKANGGRARLNFQAGAANYVYIPYVYWYLHR